MSSLQLTEKKRRSWAFALIALVWIISTMAVVQHLAPKADVNIAARRTELKIKDKVMETEELLMGQYEEISKKIKSTQFQLYQKYVISRLRQDVRGLHNIAPDVAQQSQHAAKILEMLVDAKVELVTMQRDVKDFAEQVERCREGNKDIE